MATTSAPRPSPAPGQSAAAATRRPRPSRRDATGTTFLGALTALVLPVILAVWIALAQVLVPPAVAPAGAPAAEFSAERALGFLPSIALEPHTVGSPAQARVRQYLLEQIRALGLEPVTQDTTGGVTSRTGVFASSLHNILVRIPGTASTGAVALMAHYDSQPNTPGASDDGSAVAALLESMRALRAGPALPNDVLFVLTDAEEVDAQGAEAFFWQHPWARDVRLVVNLEAAGDTGAALLMQTSSGNRALVSGFARAVPHPLASSFLTQLNALMPFGTDLSVFVDNGVPGLSPMYGWHYRIVYHSLLDNIGMLDPRSVQHQGENALGLARFFGTQDLAHLDTREDAVFFSLAPAVLVQYPASSAVPLAAIAWVLLVGALFTGLRRRRLTWRGSLAGAGLALANALLPLVASAVVWLGISRLHPEYWRNLKGAPYAADWYLAGFVALVLAVGLAVFLLARRWLAVAHLTVGALLLWDVLAIVTAQALPGTSYLFTWPAIIEGLVLIALLLWPEGVGRGASAVAQAGSLGLAAGLSILIVAPVVLWVYLLVGFWLVTMQPALPVTFHSICRSSARLADVANQPWTGHRR